MTKDTNKPLFRDLKADEIDCRVGTIRANGLSLLLYKDSRVDQNILDETFGAFNWQRRHSRDNANCEVGVWDSEKQQWIWKEDTGTESNTEKEKGESSDSFKRACFNWGIGRELYTSPKTKIKGHTNKTNRNGKDVWVPEYYAFDVVDMEVTDEMPRRITALTIIGKSMQGGYHEDEIFSWTDKKIPPKQKPMLKDEPKAEPKATPKQIEMLKKTYVGANLTKLLQANGITTIEELPMAKASEIIGKLKKKAEDKANG
jgi:hypothetical protein